MRAKRPYIVLSFRTTVEAMAWEKHCEAETIVQSTAGKNQKVLTMDSMQSMTSKDAANGATYISAMEQNLSVLKEALG